jgi:hypothetical protein
MEDDIWNRFARLDNDPENIDTGLEAVLALYDSVAVQAIRPVQAEQILPHNRASEIKLAGALFQHLQAIKFLDPQNRNRIGNYETELKFRTDKNKITQAELNAALRASISTAVDEEFNKIYVNLAWHNATLAREVQNGNYKYTLSYGGVNTNNEVRSVSGSGNSSDNALAALLSVMQNGSSKTDFRADDLTTVRSQAALIPAVAKPAELNAVKQVITNFFTTPNSNTFKAMANPYALPSFSRAYYRAISALSHDLERNL